jgi:hypothetical protein
MNESDKRMHVFRSDMLQIKKKLSLPERLIVTFKKIFIKKVEDNRFNKEDLQ